VELHELDGLPIGSGHPSSPDFDNRTLAAAHGKVVEVRLPWALLGYSDPSSLLLYVAHPKRTTTTLKAGRVRIAVLSNGSALLTTSGYTWDPWQSVTWHNGGRQASTISQARCGSSRRGRDTSRARRSPQTLEPDLPDRADTGVRSAR
jgi:hypothetical protein